MRLVVDEKISFITEHKDDLEGRRKYHWQNAHISGAGRHS